MRVWVLWTHYDCEVYVSLYATQLEAYQNLASGWLSDCDEDSCGHDSLDTVEEITDALEYHYEELSYLVEEHNVPMQQLTSERVVRPEKQKPAVSMTDVQAGGLLSALESFSHE
jgi:hypothetical protein